MAHRKFSPAQAKASAKYLSEKVDSIMVRMPKGKKAEIQAAAEAAGISVNQYCSQAIEEKLMASNRTPNDHPAKYSKDDCDA